MSRPEIVALGITLDSLSGSPLVEVSNSDLLAMDGPGLGRPYLRRRVFACGLLRLTFESRSCGAFPGRMPDGSLFGPFFLVECSAPLAGVACLE